MQFCSEIKEKCRHHRAHLEPAGNWCGHDPLKPRFYIPSSENKLRPDVIQWARAKLEEFYKKPKQWLKSIADTRSSTRQERSDGRERDAQVLGVLLDYVDLVTLQVGIPLTNGDFFSFSLKLIAKKMGWRSEQDDKEDTIRFAEGKQPRNKGIKRVWRSILVLQKAGYIVVNKRFALKEVEGRKDYRGLPAVRCILPKLFYELGISPEKLSRKRKEATKRLKKKVPTLTTTLTENSSEKAPFLGRMLNKSFKTIKPYVLSRHQQQQREQALYQKNLKRIALKQLPENQALSVAEFYAKYPELMNTS